MSDDTDYIRKHIDAAYEKGQEPSPVTDAILQIADYLGSVEERVNDLENRIAAFESTRSTPLADSAARSMQRGDHKSDADTRDDEGGGSDPLTAPKSATLTLSTTYSHEDHQYLLEAGTAKVEIIVDSPDDEDDEVTFRWHDGDDWWALTVTTGLLAELVVKFWGDLEGDSEGVEDRGGGDETGPLRDLPDEPPSFARAFDDIQPDHTERIVVWGYGRRPKLYSCDYCSMSLEPRGATVGRIDFADIKSLTGQWLPAAQCRRHGEPPDELPSYGDTITLLYEEYRNGSVHYVTEFEEPGVIALELLDAESATLLAWDHHEPPEPSGESDIGEDDDIDHDADTPCDDDILDELDDGGGDGETGPLRDLPDEPPSFARTERPEDGDRIAFWSDNAHRPILGTFSSGHSGYFTRPNSDAAQDKLVRDGQPDIIMSSQKYGAWLPATHCRIDGEPPEAKPEKGRKFRCWYDSHGDVEEQSVSFSDETEQPPYVACWVYADTDDIDIDHDVDRALNRVSEDYFEEGEGGPHSDLPGDLRDPEHWTPEDAEHVVVWWRSGGKTSALVGVYRSEGEEVEPLREGPYTPWGAVTAARPVKLRPEEGEEREDNTIAALRDIIDVPWQRSLWAHRGS